jgi:hypothetical protein
VPRRTRVTPYGELIAVADRGMFWGNRGVLVDGEGRLARYSRGKAWLICLLSYKGIRRQQWTPGRLTELFFLDEATALAAGHRPCGECRYRDYQRFKRCWAAAAVPGADTEPGPESGVARTEPGAARMQPGVARMQPGVARVLPSVHEIDARLHQDRFAVPGARRDRLAGAEVRRTYTASVSDLPDGTMADLGGVPHLLLGGRLLRWTPGGYAGGPVTMSGPVTVITPRATVAVLAAGYRPVLHETATDATLNIIHHASLNNDSQGPHDRGILPFRGISTINRPHRADGPAASRWNPLHLHDQAVVGVILTWVREHVGGHVGEDDPAGLNLAPVLGQIR